MEWEMGSEKYDRRKLVALFRYITIFGQTVVKGYCLKLLAGSCRFIGGEF